MINSLGVIFQAINISLNISYYFNGKFSSIELQNLYLIFLILRPCVIGLFSLYYCLVIIRKSLNMDIVKLKNQIHDLSTISSISTHKKKYEGKPETFSCSKIVSYILVYPVLMYTGFLRVMRPGQVLMWSKAHLFIETLSQTLPLLLIKVYTSYQVQNYQ